MLYLYEELELCKTETQVGDDANWDAQGYAQHSLRDACTKQQNPDFLVATVFGPTSEIAVLL
jgi:hypothetical protein